jgi:hypothetical protein
MAIVIANTEDTVFAMAGVDGLAAPHIITVLVPASTGNKVIQLMRSGASLNQASTMGHFVRLRIMYGTTRAPDWSQSMHTELMTGSSFLGLTFNGRVVRNVHVVKRRATRSDGSP